MKDLVALSYSVIMIVDEGRAYVVGKKEWSSEGQLIEAPYSFPRPPSVKMEQDR